jgi:hypothetical protein
MVPFDEAWGYFLSLDDGVVVALVTNL